MRIYTRRGDDGTTGLFHGGRVAKDAAGPEAYGAVDEAVSALGVARAAATDDLAAEILAIQRQLFVVAAELATNPGKRDLLENGVSRVSTAMIDGLEDRIDGVVAERGMPTEFIVPGGDHDSTLSMMTPADKVTASDALTRWTGVDATLP